MSKIIVIGANHAGTSAINTILDNYPENEVVVFDANSNISFLGCGMALWIGQQIDGPDGLFYATKEGLEAKGAKIYMETGVDHIDYDNKVVYATGKDGEKHEETFDKLILATGSLPIVPNVEGKDLENVQMVKLYQNAEEVINKLKGNDEFKNIVVVGAGYIGVELAEAFKRLDKEVTLVDLADKSLSAYYDPEFSDLMDQNLKEHGINLAFGESVEKIKGDGKVEAVVTNKREIPADMVVLAVGFRPNNALGEGKLETFRNGAFLVDKKGETSVKDVYAIGDCATVYDNATNQFTYIALATNALRSGMIAARNACGDEIESLGVQGSNGICIFDYKMLSTGLSEKKAERAGIEVESVELTDLQKPAFIQKEENADVKIKVVYEKATKRIVGAQMASTYDISMGLHMFSLAIQEQLTVDRLKYLDLFFLPHFNQPFNYINQVLLKIKD